MQQTAAVIITGANSPLRHHNFRRLMAGATASQFGNAITPIALAFAVLDLGGSATDLGLVVAAFALAQVVTSLFGGVLGDRVPRKLMMEGSAFACSLVQVGVAALLISGRGSMLLLTVGGVLTAVFGALSQPSSMAMTRLTVPPDLIAPAVAVRQFGQTAAGVLGFALAGVLVSVIGPGWSIAIDAGTFLLAGLAYSRLRVVDEKGESRGTIFGDLREGFREVLARSWMWTYILMALTYHLVYGGAQAILGPIVIGEGMDRAAWGFAMGALMGGFMLGSLFCLRLTAVRHPMRVSILFLMLTPLFPLAMGLSHSLVPILVCGFLHGFGLQVSDYLWDLSIQQHIAPALLSRVYSIDIVGSFVCRPLGLVLTGPIVALVGERPWLVIVAGTLIVLQVALLFVPSLRNLTQPETPPTPLVADPAPNT